MEASHNPTQPAWRAALALADGVKRCGAKTRSGKPCQSPSMQNGRCRMHGGSSPGAPCGKAHGQYKHGLYTKEAKALRAFCREMLEEAREVQKLELRD